MGQTLLKRSPDMAACQESGSVDFAVVASQLLLMIQSIRHHLDAYHEGASVQACNAARLQALGGVSHGRRAARGHAGCVRCIIRKAQVIEQLNSKGHQMRYVPPDPAVRMLLGKLRQQPPATSGCRKCTVSVGRPKEIKRAVSAAFRLGASGRARHLQPVNRAKMWVA